MEVISSQLIGSELVPSSLIKTLLYPGAIAKSLLRRSPPPSYHNLFHFYHFHHLNRASSSSSLSTDDIRHLEVFCFLLYTFLLSHHIRTNLASASACTGVCWLLFMSARSFAQHLQTQKTNLHWHPFDLLGSSQRHSSIQLLLCSSLPNALSRFNLCIPLHTKRCQEDHPLLLLLHL